MLMLSHAHVLVADDDPQLLDVVAESLKRLGADVVRARSGADLIGLGEKAVLLRKPFELSELESAASTLLSARRPWGIGEIAMSLWRSGRSDKSRCPESWTRDQLVQQSLEGVEDPLLRRHDLSRC